MTARKPAETHHARILEEMRNNIVDGVWEPGFRLPKETELATQYGVSRMTMNKVLTQLSREGFLIRRKRSGTFVAQPRAQSAVMEINDIAQEVAELGFDYEWRLSEQELRPLGRVDCRMLDIDDDRMDAQVLFLDGLHMARGAPFCLETRVIDTAMVPAALQEDFKTTVPGQWLLKTMPFSSARHRVRAINVAGQDAKHLGLPVGTACLEILRKTRIEQSWVTHVRLLYPGEAHQLIADFAP